jgi:hypothetical protein
MSNPKWLLPSSKQWMHRRRVRKNLLFAGRNPLDRYVEDMNRSGVRPIRYLTHLGIVIGEYLTPSASHVLDGHCGVIDKKKLPFAGI